MKKALAWEIPNAGLPRRLDPAAIALEEHLEDWIDADISIVADDVLLIGRQVRTEDGGRSVTEPARPRSDPDS